MALICQQTQLTLESVGCLNPKTHNQLFYYQGNEKYGLALVKYKCSICGSEQVAIVSEKTKKPVFNIKCYNSECTEYGYLKAEGVKEGLEENNLLWNIVDRQLCSCKQIVVAILDKGTVLLYSPECEDFEIWPTELVKSSKAVR